MPKTIVNTKEWDALLKKLRGVSKRVAKVGVLESKGGGAPHGDSGFSIADIATLHEYGNHDIPERSFVRGTMLAREDQIVSAKEKLAGKMYTQEVSQEQALEALGLLGSSLIKGYIVAGENFEPLKPATVARKGSSKPLIDTGQLLNSISYEVDEA